MLWARKGSAVLLVKTLRHSRGPRRPRPHATGCTMADRDSQSASVGLVGLAESDGDAGVDVKTDIACLFAEFGSLLDKPCISYTCMRAINQGINQC